MVQILSSFHSFVLSFILFFLQIWLLLYLRKKKGIVFRCLLYRHSNRPKNLQTPQLVPLVLISASNQIQFSRCADVVWDTVCLPVISKHQASACRWIDVTVFMGQPSYNPVLHQSSQTPFILIRTAVYLESIPGSQSLCLNARWMRQEFRGFSIQYNFVTQKVRANWKNPKTETRTAQGWSGGSAAVGWKGLEVLFFMILHKGCVIQQKYRTVISCGITIYKVTHRLQRQH